MMPTTRKIKRYKILFIYAAAAILFKMRHKIDILYITKSKN